MTDLNILFLQKVREGDLSAIIRCLDQGADIHTDGDKALKIAANKGCPEIVRLLLDRGADIHAEEDRALQAAAENGHADVVCLLLDRGADIHARDDHVLSCATWTGETEVVRLLLDRGANIHAKEDQALQLAARQGYLDLILLLLDRGADIHAGGGEALRSAALEGKIEAVSLLLDRGANIKDGEYSALHHAAYSGHLEVVCFLLDRGADIHANNDLALRSSVYRGHLEVVRFLLDRGADPKELDFSWMDCPSRRMLVSHSRYRLTLDQEKLRFFLRDPPLFRARLALRYVFFGVAKAYLYSPWSRSNTENLELLNLEGDEEANRRSLRRHRDTLITQVMDNPRWTHDYLLHKYSEVPWGDDSRGLRSLIGDGNPRPSRRQLICRLPTSILEELAS